MVLAYAAPEANRMFPAIVTRPDGAVEDGRLAILTVAQGDQPAMLVIYAEGGDGGVVRPYTEAKIPYVSARPDPSTSYGWIVNAEDGTVWSYRMGRGCGCKSPLKGIGSPVPLDLGD